MMEMVDSHGLLDIRSSPEEWALNVHFSISSSSGGGRGKSIEIAGSSVNGLLLGLFLSNGYMRVEEDNLPGGLRCWTDIIEPVCITLPTLVTMPEVASRIFFLVEEYLAPPRSERKEAFLLHHPSLREDQSVDLGIMSSGNLLFGGVAFLTTFVGSYNEYLNSSQIVELQMLAECLLEKLEQDVQKRKRRVKTMRRGLDQDEVDEAMRGDMYLASQKLVQTITAVSTERSWIHLGMPPPHSSSSSSRQTNDFAFHTGVLPSAEIFSKPCLRELRGSWVDVATRRQSVKASMAKAAKLKIDVFGGAAMLDNYSDDEEDDPDDHVPGECPQSRIPSGKSLLMDPSSLDLWVIDLLELARQWTLVDHALFCAIPPSSFLKPAWAEPRHLMSASPIRAFIDRFNSASLWTSSMVLSGETPEERAEKFHMLVTLAGHLESLHNYNGLMAVLTGLQQGCISRLRETIDLILEEDREKVTSLQKLMAGNKNYQTYRDALKDIEAKMASSHRGSIVEAVVPHLGAHLAELSTISEGNPEHLPEVPHLVNITKKKLMARSVMQLSKLQKLRYLLKPVRLVATVLSRSLDAHTKLTAAESSESARRLYELSLLREPLVVAKAREEEEETHIRSVEQIYAASPTPVAKEKNKGIFGGLFSKKKSR